MIQSCFFSSFNCDVSWRHSYFFAGVAYFGSICRPYVNGYRVDIIRDLDWNGAIVGVHEIGHS